MNTSFQTSPSPPPAVPVRSGFENVILQLVKSDRERQAIVTGQIDAIVDPATGTAILLPLAQQALLTRKAEFQHLIELSFDWYWEQDEHYRFTSYACTSREDDGFVSQAIIGKTIWEIVIGDNSDGDWQTHRQQLEWRYSFRELEMRCIDAQGAVRDLSVSGEPIFDAQDRFKGYRGITRDISARKRREAMLRAMEEADRTSIDAAACVPLQCASSQS